MGSSMTEPPPASESAPEEKRRDLWRWQLRLLRFTKWFLVVIAVGFLALSLWNVYQMQRFVRDEGARDVRKIVEGMLPDQKDPQSGVRNLDRIWMTLLVIEADAIDKRYHHASALLMSRIWTRQLAFMTGMLLAFIGSVFILGKFEEKRTSVDVGTGDGKAGISSTSPGLVLAFMGTVLMAISLVVQPKIQVQDRPIYFAPMSLVSGTSPAATASTSTGLPKPINPFTLQPPSEPDGAAGARKDVP